MDSDKKAIMQDIRKSFVEWNRTNYHNRTIATDERAWRAWQAALLNDRRESLSELEPEDYQAVSTKQWMRKEVSALKNSLKKGLK